MIRLIQRWRAERLKQKRIRECRANGHFLEDTGGNLTEASPAGVPLEGAKPAFGLYACKNKCGYGEVNELNMKPYHRTWKEAERLTALAKRGGAK